MRRTIFAKGNLDVRDTLIALRLGDRVAWNGINELLRMDGSDVRLRVRHETCSRSDALLAADGAVPSDLAAWSDLPWGAFPPAAQFSQAFLDGSSDAYVMSIMPDVYTRLYRHRRLGYLIHVPARGEWPGAARAWLASEFAPVGLLSAAECMQGLRDLVEQIRMRSAAPILVYNVSAVMPSEQIHCWEGVQETFSTRVTRFNLALTALSRETGISIVDIDRIVASMGARIAKRDQIHLTAAGCEAVAREVLRILRDVDVLPLPQPHEPHAAT